MFLKALGFEGLFWRVPLVGSYELKSATSSRRSKGGLHFVIRTEYQEVCLCSWLSFGWP